MGRRLRALFAVTLTAGLMACGQLPVLSPTSDAAEGENTLEYANDLLRQAAEAAPEERLELMLRAAESLAAAGDTEWAQSIVNTLPRNVAVTPESGTSYGRLALINSYIASGHGDFQQAIDRLDDPHLLSHSGSYPVELQRNLLEQRAQALYELARIEESIAARVHLDELIPDNALEQERNRELIWQMLMHLPDSELAALRANARDRDLQGWYSLATINKNNQNNLREQLERVERWTLDWPDHPASLNLPADLKLLQELVNNQPTQIAVLLPFSGRLGAVGNAVRDGLAAGYYQNLGGDFSPQIRFYNTDQQDINTLYDQAVADGAQVVIGPLNKENIAELALRPALPVPTLALNTIDMPLGRVENLYQFGLGVEDEAMQTAERAWRDGHRRILILASDNQWGDRSVETFVAAWEALGGEILGEHRYSDEGGYSQVLQQALQLDESQARARAVRSAVGEIQFEPRRREDVDAIFLVAQAVHARQIKPTLAFHYAANIPVYATSQVYSGQDNPKLDQDMNGIRFLTLPWFFDRKSPERSSILRHADSKPNLQPLYALGIDSFYLSPRLKQLSQSRHATFYGLTGSLQMNDEGQVVRRQLWMEFARGTARRLREGI